MTPGDGFAFGTSWTVSPTPSVADAGATESVPSAGGSATTWSAADATCPAEVVAVIVAFPGATAVTPSVPQGSPSDLRKGLPTAPNARDSAGRPMPVPQPAPTQP